MASYRNTTSTNNNSRGTVKTERGFQSAVSFASSTNVRASLSKSSSNKNSISTVRRSGLIKDFHNSVTSFPWTTRQARP
nr:hypothetical protein [Tanacetum cinerariifolium]GFB98231.1 hypothetical protein [Tanacetum cinerariifolium]